MSLPPTGRYYIINVYTKNYAKLPDANEGSSVIGHSDDGGNTFKWTLDALANGAYTIKNVEQARFANSGNMPTEGTHVVGSSSMQQWRITDLGSGKYTIATTDNGHYWHLENNNFETPVTVVKNGTNNKSHWEIKKAT